MAERDTYSEEQINRIRACCGVFGFELSLHREAYVAFRKASHAMRERPPSLLLRRKIDPTGVLGQLALEYQRSNRDGQTINLLEGDEGLLPDLRECLAQVIGVTPGLLPVVDPPAGQEDPEGASAAGLAALEARFPDGVKRAHHRTFGHLLQDRDGNWYSHDRAGHGGSLFKRHVEQNGALIWDADLDQNLVAISGKHKGRVGRRIPVAELSFSDVRRRDSHVGEAGVNTGDEV